MSVRKVRNDIHETWLIKNDDSVFHINLKNGKPIDIVEYMNSEIYRRYEVSDRLLLVYEELIKQLKEDGLWEK